MSYSLWVFLPLLISVQEEKEQSQHKQDSKGNSQDITCRPERIRLETGFVLVILQKYKKKKDLIQIKKVIFIIRSGHTSGQCTYKEKNKTMPFTQLQDIKLFKTSCVKNTFLRDSENLVNHKKAQKISKISLPENVVH